MEKEINPFNDYHTMKDVISNQNNNSINIDMNNFGSWFCDNSTSSNLVNKWKINLLNLRIEMLKEDIQQTS